MFHDQGKRCTRSLYRRFGEDTRRYLLVITHKSPRPREAGVLDACAPEILRCAQDDNTPGCHPERSAGSLADF